ncbi:hypothetical protein [Synechococcus sp. GFB01]|uniref:hypothetical protein n=1 Tax=Synechococcus sp. GFB01 TaxID=1662190 RepID=UPI000A5D2BDF|nr:hypothetical protein [Synechococcus sp. GFB01]
MKPISASLQRPLLTRASVGVIGLSGIAILMAGLFGIPHEDSAILYSYSDNLANTGVISFYPGGPRAEGATDFGRMILIAALSGLGISNHLASALLNIAFISLLWWQFVQHFTPICSKPARNSCFALAVFLLIFLGSGAATSGLWGFSTIAVSALASCVLLMAAFTDLPPTGIAIGISLLLIRPDGIVWYGSIMLFALISRSFFGDLRGRNNLKRRATVVVRAILPLTVLAVYWAARWIYFGNPFPLPFYVKQGAVDGLVPWILASAKDLAVNPYQGMALILCICCWQLSRIYISPNNVESDPKELSATTTSSLKAAALPEFSRRLPILTAITAGSVVTQSFYLSRFVLEQNMNDRFHAPSLAVSAALLGLSAAAIMERCSTPGIRTPRLFLPMLLLVGCLMNYITNARMTIVYALEVITESTRNNILLIAKDLASLGRSGQASDRPLLLVTEAGRLNYYSKLPTIDAWGLNTASYSKMPLLDPTDIRRLAPDLIGLHGSSGKPNYAYVLEALSKSPPRRDWEEMTKAIVQGAVLSKNGLSYDIYMVPFFRTVDQPLHRF